MNRPGMPRPDPEARREIPAIASREMKHAIGRGEPFIVRGHPLVQRLAAKTSLEALAEKLAGRKVEVQHKHRWVRSSQEVDVADYIRGPAFGDYYWRHFLLASFNLKVSLPKPGPRGCTYFDYGWIGPSDTIQTFHQDNHDNLFVNHNLFAQVVGRKYVAVAAPSDSGFFRSLPLAPGDNRHSKALPWNEETRRECTTLAETKLEAGDLLYVPPRFWHCMRSCSKSVSISRWWFTSRIAELLYASETGIEVPRRPGQEQEWATDLVEFGGAPILNEFLSKKPVIARLRFVLMLTGFYGKGILHGQGKES